MYIKQISVFLENRPGRMNSMIKVLSDNNINLRALSLADTKDFGVARIIADAPEKCIEVLKKNSFTVSQIDVVAIEVDDKVGGLSKVLDEINNAGVNIEYMYAFVEKHRDNAVLIFRFSPIDQIAEKLKTSGLKIMSDIAVLND